MKTIKLLIVVALSLAATATTAQKRGNLTITPSDTIFRVRTAYEDLTLTGNQAVKEWSRRKYDSRKNTEKWKWNSGKFAGVNLYYNGLAENIGMLATPNTPYLQLSNKSVGVDLNFFDAVIFSSGCFGIVTGVGIESNNFRFQKNISLTKDENGMTVADDSWNERGIELEKSKLTTTYLNVPILFQFKFGERGTFSNDDVIGGDGHSNGWVSFGIVGGVRLQSYTKVKADQIGKVRTFGDYNLQNFHYGFLFSAGYGCFSINAKYYPHSMFNPGFGPNVQQFNVGVGLMF